MLCSTVAGWLCIVLEQLNTIEGRGNYYYFFLGKGDGEGVLKETADVLKHSRWINFVVKLGKR